jgi:hypothetical protein
MKAQYVFGRRLFVVRSGIFRSLDMSKVDIMIGKNGNTRFFNIVLGSCLALTAVLCSWAQSAAAQSSVYGAGGLVQQGGLSPASPVVSRSVGDTFDLRGPANSGMSSFSTAQSGASQTTSGSSLATKTLATKGGAIDLGIGNIGGSFCWGSGCSIMGLGLAQQRIGDVACRVLSLPMGSFGALIAVVAGLFALVCAAIGAYKPALSVIVIGAGAWVLIPVIQLFFPIDCGSNWSNWGWDYWFGWSSMLMGFLPF